MNHCAEKSPGGRRCFGMAVLVADTVLTLARERARDGMVSVDDIERIAGLMRSSGMVLDTVLRGQEDRCREEFTRPKGNVGTRSNPFNRLMVRPFEALVSGDPPVLARPYLENYFQYLGFAFENRLEGFERHCRAIVQALMVVHGNNLTWDHFYADPRTLKTLGTALKVLLDGLQSPDGQQLWYACMSRPAGDLFTPTIDKIDMVRTVLVETHRGLCAKAD